MKINFIRKVFISHAEEDSEIAHNISFALKKRLNVDVSLDKYFLLAGDRWKNTIYEEINASELVIVLESRLVSAKIASGVVDEIELAKELGVPVILGMIRGHKVLHESNFQIIDFGKDGKNEDAVFEIAKFLLIRSQPFAPMGLAAITASKEEASKIHGNTPTIATTAENVYVIGHTLKSWLEDYGNHIRFGKAKIRLYLPSKKDPCINYLQVIHTNGKRIVEEIVSAKKRAIALNNEEGFEKDKLECYVLKVKPMFSLMAVDIDKPYGFFTIDNYLSKVSSENRPKLIIYRKDSHLFKLFEKILNDLIENSTPLKSISQ